MNNRGVSIKYGDVAPEAKENFDTEASESEFGTVSQLKQYNIDFPNYSNPCELYQTVLDGTALAFPSNPEAEKMGLWSEQISNEDGTFDEPIVLTLTAKENYSSQGLTLTFDNYNNIYSNYLNIKWYRENELIENDDFYPNGAFYFCHKKVNAYNKVIITFYSLNMPKNRLKLRAIDYGYGTVFYGNELRNTKVIQEIDPISSEISINTVDFVLDSKSNIDYSFQTRQPLSVYFNGKLKATVFVKSSKRKSKTLWQVQAEDYIGLLDGVYFEGGVYVDKNAAELIGEIFQKAKIPYSLDDCFGEEKVTGYIPYGTCRAALMQVVFAIQAVVDTSNSDVVKIFALDDNISKTIPLNRIKQGQNFDEEDTVTAVEVAAHAYSKTQETTEAYRADDGGYGQEIMVVFSEPLHSLSITDGQILSFGETFALINAGENCVLVGKKYEHTTQTKQIRNPIASASETEKIMSIKNATLVSFANLDNVLNKCYNYLVRNMSVNLEIVEGKRVVVDHGSTYGTFEYGSQKYGTPLQKETFYDDEVSVGDFVESETEYLGNINGRIIRQTFNLNGGIIIKKAVLK